jgi:hypothetical protein
VAHNRYLRCIKAATGLHEVAKLPVCDKPGDKSEFLP